MHRFPIVSFTILEEEDLVHRDLFMKADPVLRFLLEYLRDGRWHEREEVMSAALHITPPGLAYRKAESRRINKIKNEAIRRGDMTAEEAEEFFARPENVARKYEREYSSQESIIRTGQRMFVTDALNGTKRIEIVDSKDGKKWVRRVPLQPEVSMSKSAQERRALMKEVIDAVTAKVQKQ